MSEVLAPSVPLPGPIHPPAVSLREIWPWAVLALALLTLVYLVGLDEGATSIVPGRVIHEFAHDGRHLLGFPCH